MRDLLARILDWCLQPACPWCGTRTPDLETHYTVDHAGDWNETHP